VDAASPSIPLATPPPTRAERLALRVIQLGSIAVVLVASTYRVFDLDRFLIPKELALHATALLAGVLALRALRRTTMTSVDRLLLVYLLLSALSAATATNRWLGLRALAISVSAIVLFWVARALREAGLGRALLAGLAIAVAVVALTSLAQTYGLRLDIFSLNRAPGGTLGNRNFVAHAAAFGFPIVLLAALRAGRFSSFLWSAAGVMTTAAALVLTRSRAAWLAFAAVVIVFFVAMIVSGPLRRDGRTWRRSIGVLVLAALAVAAALALPNTLRWRSENPYLESVQGVANYQEGSGHGRLVQYGRSLLVALRHPLLGVGPGNWPVVYPRHAPDNDPSMNPSEPGMTFNPWPSSDWVAFIAERGFAAAIVLALVFFRLIASALRQLFNAADAAEGIVAAALLATIAGACVAGAFDAVLLLALPTMIVWTALGALWTPDAGVVSGWFRRAEPRSHASIPVVLGLGLVALAAIGAARSVAQVVAMDTFATESSRAALERASQIDPGSYRLHLRLARGGKRSQRCAHAMAAVSLFPDAEAARQVSRGCR
jgi:O-antigen ligase